MVSFESIKEACGRELQRLNLSNVRQEFDPSHLPVGLKALKVHFWDGDDGSPIEPEKILLDAKKSNGYPWAYKVPELIIDFHTLGQALWLMTLIKPTKKITLTA